MDSTSFIEVHVGAESHPDLHEEGEEPRPESRVYSLEERFDRNAPDDLDVEEGDKAKKMLRRNFRWEREERPSPAELLEDLFFQ